MKPTRQAAWKKRSGFEQTEARRLYKAEWARANRKSKKNSVDTTPILKVGDKVTIELTLNGKLCKAPGYVVGSTIGSDGKLIPYDAEGTFTVEWKYRKLSGTTSLPQHKVSSFWE